MVINVAFFTRRPLICPSRSSGDGLMYSMTPSLLASSAFRFRLETTNSRAAVVFRPCMRALSSIRAITALMVLLSFIGSVPVIDSCTGWAEPMMVCGAMAATSEPKRIRVPADQAVAPSG